MNVEINDWLNASQDKGNPNVDGTDVNIVCSANTGKVKPQQETDIQFLISTDVKYFTIPETAVSIYSPADDKVINVSDTYTGINIQTANPFAIEANMYFYFS